MLTKKVVSKFLRTKPHCNIGTIGHVDHVMLLIGKLLKCFFSSFLFFFEKKNLYTKIKKS